MLNIQNSFSSTSATTSSSGGGTNYHLTAASSRGPGCHLPQLQFQQDLPITSGTLSRAKSDTSLGTVNGCRYNDTYHLHPHQLHHNNHVAAAAPLVPPSDQNFRPKSMAIPINSNLNGSPASSAATEPAHVGFAKSLYAYLSNGDNQLCFLEGDVIALIGERNRGWQFGENVRTQKMGWFPVAYTETLEHHQVNQHEKVENSNLPVIKPGAGPSPVPPPMPPLPPNLNVSQSNAGSKHANTGGKGAKANLQIPSGRTSDSLHSSNDSGFSNDLGHHPNRHGQVPPPPQPEVDYSDEEPPHRINR